MSDLTTQSNYDAIATTDVELDWLVDVDARTISGSALHGLKVLAEDGVGKAVYVVLAFFRSTLRRRARW
jgi:hypothetical protein